MTGHILRMGWNLIISKSCAEFAGHPSTWTASMCKSKPAHDLPSITTLIISAVSCHFVCIIQDTPRKLTAGTWKSLSFEKEHLPEKTSTLGVFRLIFPWVYVYVSHSCQLENPTDKLFTRPEKSIITEKPLPSEEDRVDSWKKTRLENVNFGTKP